MSMPPVTIRLDPRRLDQLKAIAAAMQLSNAGAISAFIREKIAAGVIPADIPGIVVRKSGDDVRVGLREGEESTMTKVGALALASTIREVVSGASAPNTIRPGQNFSVYRQGTSIKIVLPFSATKVEDAPSFPHDLALDLADLVEREAE